VRAVIGIGKKGGVVVAIIAEIVLGGISDKAGNVG
jgi:hypothetical protein